MATIFGKSGPGRSETIIGTADSDTINPLGGDDLVDGGRGFDTVVVEAKSTDFRISTINGVTYLDTATGASSGKGVTLKNIESVKFTDRTLSLVVNDRLINSPGADFPDGGPGLDSFVYSAPRSAFTVSASFGSATASVKRNDGSEGSDFLTSIERLEFSDGKRVALDLDTQDSAGKAVLLVGAVLGKNAVAAKPDLMGTLIGLFDAGVSLQALSGAVLRLPIWGGVLTATNSSEDIARHLLTVVNRKAPTDAEVNAGATALRTEALQGSWLADLAGSAANQVQVDLVGLRNTGLDYAGPQG